MHADNRGILQDADFVQSILGFTDIFCCLILCSLGCQASNGRLSFLLRFNYKIRYDKINLCTTIYCYLLLHLSFSFLNLSTDICKEEKHHHFCVLLTHAPLMITHYLKTITYVFFVCCCNDNGKKIN